MRKLLKRILLWPIHFVYQSKRIKKEIANFAQNIHNKAILEIGSGKTPAIDLFDKSNKFVLSDIAPQLPGTLKIDVAQMDIAGEYDLLVCINVLDDVFEYQRAVDNMHKALKDGGKVFLVVNGFYPLHDLPDDYWRFTESSLRKIFAKFKEIQIKKIGLSRFPSYYILTATK